ncbi:MULTISPECIES: histidinol-phosphate transaminase [unclassified Nocardia]|uniref:pyridoxal phosphate-dependent aminotransferase n=1 Tax=unclassified Nocardia TaxID=2637762 RepID=UPI001CE454DD|nr:MULTISPECIES: aminotransferase class I/II-fold pyridoxal phosphate-dependent enzyme [unclassified Nocardia]
MRTSTAIDALRDVLCAALGSTEPVCAATEAGLTGPDRPTLIGGGALFGPTSPAPTPGVIEDLLRRAERLRAPQILVPYVRRTDDLAPLRAGGFVPFAAGVECVLRLGDSVDETLRTRVGADRLAELRRLHRDLAEHTTWERIRLRELAATPWAWDACVKLPPRNGNFSYNARALDALARGPLAERVEVLVRRRDGAVVQVGLIAASQNGRGTYHLAHAVDDAAVDHENLYAATVYELCLDAWQSGLDWIHLGRVDAEDARSLGADLFIPLDNWLRAPGLAPVAPAEPALSDFAAPPVAEVAAPPGPVRFRLRPKFDLIDMSGNTNPFLGREARYPDLDTTELARSYLAAIAALPGGDGALTPDHLLFTSGAVDGLALLLSALTSPGETVCVTPPTFELYAHFARVQRLPVVEVPLRGAAMSELDNARILAAGPRVTVLCDPNNPVGTRLDRAQVRELIASSHGLVVIDEAYVEFSREPSYAALIDRYENLVVLRTLSKAWGLASARCGIVLARPGVIEALRRVQVPFGFTDASQRAVRERLSNAHLALDTVPRILAERDRLAAGLSGHPAVREVFPSDANFLFVRLREHERAMARLRGAGIIVADTGRLVPDTCRISVGSPDTNDLLLQVL